MQFIKQHKLLVGILVIVVAGGVWYGMTSDNTPESLITTEIVDGGSPSEDSADRELVESLLTLRAITLSGTIFTDPAFVSLKDFGTMIIAEPVGRENPFAPLRRAAPSPTQSQSATPRR